MQCRGLCSRFLLAMRKCDQSKSEMRRLLVPPTKPQNGCEKSIEYYQLKAATLAREGQQVFMADIFTLHAGKAVLRVAAIEVPVNDLLQIADRGSHASTIRTGGERNLTLFM